MKTEIWYNSLSMKKLLPVLTAVCVFSAWAQSPEETVRKMEENLRSLETFQAQFSQTYYSSSVTMPLEESGWIYYRKPGWMRWDYMEPEKKTILVRGGEVSYYFPEDNQVILHSVDENERESNIVSLLSGKRSILEDHDAEPAIFPVSGSNTEQIKLIPKNEMEAESYVLLEIDRDTHFIQKAVFFDWTGNKQEFLFTHVKTGIRLPEGIFELDLPPEVEIIKSPSS